MQMEECHMREHFLAPAQKYRDFLWISNTAGFSVDKEAVSVILRDSVFEIFKLILETEDDIASSALKIAIQNNTTLCVFLKCEFETLAWSSVKPTHFCKCWRTERPARFEAIYCPYVTVLWTWCRRLRRAVRVGCLKRECPRVLAVNAASRVSERHGDSCIFN